MWYYDWYPLKDNNTYLSNGAVVYRNNGYLAKLGISGTWFTARYQLSAMEINPEFTNHSGAMFYSKYLDPYEFFGIGNNFFLRKVDNKNVTPVLSIALTKVYTYKNLSGNWTQKWGQIQNFLGLEGTNAREYFSGYDYVWFDLPPNTNDIPDPTYPVDVLPGTEAHLSYGVQVECQAHNSFWNMAVNHGIHDDDGLYKITSVDSYECKTADGVTYYGYIYGVARVDDNYNEYEDWQGFWCAGYFTDQFRIELDNKSIPNHSVVIGPFRASPIGAQCRYVELDFNAPSGLCRVEDDGDYAPLSVKFQVYYQRVGDETWKTFDPIIMSGKNQDELGLTVKYDMKTKADWQFMVKRITPMHKDDTKYIDTVKWNGLKSRLEESPTKYDGMTTIFMRITGSEVLTEMNNNQISTLWTRKLPNLTDGTLEATSEIAPVLKYIMSTSKYPNIFDLDNLKEYNDYWSIRGLQFNGTFDEDNTLLDAVRSVMQVGFAEPVVNGDKLQASMQRKMSRDNFTTILSAETITDFQFLKTPRRADEPLEVCVKYTSPETYKSENVYIYYNTVGSAHYQVLPYPSSNNIENLDAFGVTSKDQAVALGQRRLRQLIYMRESYTVKTEMLGLTLNFNDFIGLSLPLDTSKMADVVARIIGYYTDGDYLLLKLDRVINNSNSTETSKRCFYINTEGKAVHLTKQGTTRDVWPRQLGFYKTTLEELGIVWDERYGNELDYPLLCSEHSDGSFIRPCWVRSIESDGSTCTIKLVQYHDEVYAKDPQFTLGYGLSSYGDSPYGKSY